MLKNNRIVRNASWIIVCRIVQALLSFIISMLTARYLGPSNFGVINYAASVVAFVTPVMKLGLDSVLVQEFVNHPKEDGETLGTSLALNMLSSLLCMAGVLLFTAVANPSEPETIIVCALYSLMLPAQAAEMIQYWYQAKLLSKYTSLVSLGAYLITSVYKIYLLVSAKSVYWFAVSHAIDYSLIAIALYFMYKKMGGGKLHFSANKARQMFSGSKFFIISGLMVTVFAQTDRIMLKMMLDDASVGCYSAAVSCAGMAGFVFSAIIDSLRPVILASKQESKMRYELCVKQLYALIISLALLQSVFISVFAELIIDMLYGSQYDAAVDGLRVIVWYTTFSYYGGAKDVWILAEGKQKYLIWLNLSGALANVVLNAVLIPAWGIVGAATASLITQFLTNIVMGFVIKPLRYNNMLLLQSMNPKYLREILTAFGKLAGSALRREIN